MAQGICEKHDNKHEISDGEEKYRLRITLEDGAANSAVMSEKLTISDLKSAIRSSAKRKSPGIDGLPAEFYQRIFDIIYREISFLYIISR